MVRSDRGDLVLTAAHVVVTPGDSCKVRVRGSGRTVSATVVWCCERADVAVLRLDDVLDGEFGPEPDWARCGHADLDCSAIGYPTFQTHDEKPDTEELAGRLRPHAGLERGMLNIIHAAGQRPDQDWRGMSGAALFAHGMLIGVVSKAKQDRMLAWPVARLFDDPSFVDQFGTSLRGRLRHDALWPDADRGALDCLVDWKALPRPSEDRPSLLLRANYEVVPFADELRARELEALERFTLAPGSGIQVVLGPGGSGKTRLLLEWARRTRARDWIAGFVDGKVEDLRPAAHGVTPRLLVVDYAMTQIERVIQLVHAMIRARGQTTTKLVLVDRRRGSWIDRLRDDDRVAELLDANPVIELEQLPNDQARHSYAAAYRAFAGVEPNDELEDNELGEHLLWTHMRALLRYLDGPDAAAQHEQVLARVLTHERKFWLEQLRQHLGRNPPGSLERDADRLGAALVLCNSVAQPQLAQLAKRACVSSDPTELEALCVAFGQLYVEGTQVVGLGPDLLGEQLVLEIMSWDEDHRGTPALSAWLSLPFDREIHGAIGRCLTVLTRLSVDRRVERARTWLTTMLRTRATELIPGRGGPPGPIVASALLATDDLDAAERFKPELDTDSIEQSDLAWASEQVIVNARRRELDDDASRDRLAEALRNLGASLRQLGRREEALDASREAVELHRELTDRNPAEFAVKLAGSLNNYGNHLAALGRHAQALTVSEAAVDITMRLGDSIDEDGLCVAALCLANLGLRLYQSQQPEQSLETIFEALALHEELINAGRADLIPRHINTLNTCAMILHQLGRTTEAVEVARMAATGARELVGVRPDRFKPLLWRLINNLGTYLGDLELHDEALALAHETVAIAEQLHEARPEEFASELAAALDNLGNCLSKVGSFEEAGAANRRAIELFRVLADERPDVFLPSLGLTLDNLGHRLRDLGQPESALEAAREALAIREDLAARQPELFEPSLLTALSNYAARLDALQRRGDAFVIGERALELCRKLHDRSPDASSSTLAQCLRDYGALSSHLGRHQEGIASQREAVGILELLYTRQPGLHQGDFADALDGLAQAIANRGVDHWRTNEFEQAARDFADALRHAIESTAISASEDHRELVGRLALDYSMSCLQAGLPVVLELIDAAKVAIAISPTDA